MSDFAAFTYCMSLWVAHSLWVWCNPWIFLFLCQAKMKQLEQEAHRAAGQIFLLTSNTQLRTVGCEWLCYCAADVYLEMGSPPVRLHLFGASNLKNICPPHRVCLHEYHCLLKCFFFSICLYAHFNPMGLFTPCMYNVLQVLFEKLCLHEQCENRKLPRTLNKQQQSTSEAAVRHLQTHWDVSLDPIPVFFQWLHALQNTDLKLWLPSKLSCHLQFIDSWCACCMHNLIFKSSVTNLFCRYTLKLTIQGTQGKMNTENRSCGICSCHLFLLLY